MRFLVPLFVFLAVAAFHTVLSASLGSAEKEEKVVLYDGLAELQKIDQVEFEAAQKNQAAQMNVTEEPNEDTRYLEAVQDGSVEEEHAEAEKNNTAEGGGNAADPEESESESSEEIEGRQRREHDQAVTETVSSLDEVSQDSTKQQVDEPSSDDSEFLRPTRKYLLRQDVVNCFEEEGNLNYVLE